MLENVIWQPDQRCKPPPMLTHSNGPAGHPSNGTHFYIFYFLSSHREYIYIHRGTTASCWGRADLENLKCICSYVADAVVKFVHINMCCVCTSCAFVLRSCMCSVMVWAFEFNQRMRPNAAAPKRLMSSTLAAVTGYAR